MIRKKLTHHEGSKSFRIKKEIREETMIEIEVAKPFKMLSAYFMTTATVIPPSAWGREGGREETWKLQVSSLVGSSKFT